MKEIKILLNDDKKDTAQSDGKLVGVLHKMMSTHMDMMRGIASDMRKSQPVSVQHAPPVINVTVTAPAASKSSEPNKATMAKIIANEIKRSKPKILPPTVRTVTKTVVKQVKPDLTSMTAAIVKAMNDNKPTTDSKGVMYVKPTTQGVAG